MINYLIHSCMSKVQTLTTEVKNTPKATTNITTPQFSSNFEHTTCMPNGYLRISHIGGANPTHGYRKQKKSRDQTLVSIVLKIALFLLYQTVHQARSQSYVLQHLVAFQQVFHKYKRNPHQIPYMHSIQEITRRK